MTMTIDRETELLLKKTLGYNHLTFKQCLSVAAAIGWRADVVEEMVAGEKLRLPKSADWQRLNRLDRYRVAKVPDVSVAKKRPYVTGLREMADGYHYREWRKRQVAIITSPSGASFRVVDGDTHVWVSRNSEMSAETREALVKALGYDPDAAPLRQPRGDQLLGQCPVCNSEQVTHDGRMVLHGYRRPGDGWIDGRCFGVDHPAYNLSADGCHAYMTWCQSKIVRYREHLADLKADKVNTFEVKTMNYGSTETVVRGDPGFEKAREGAIRSTEQNIDYVREEVKRMKHAIAVWQARPLRAAV